MLGFSIRIAMAVGVVLGTGPALGDDGEGYGPQHGLEELRFAAPLTPQARDRLNAGQALPVIVTFALPEGLEQSRAPGDAAFLERQRLIRETQDDVLRATFGSSLDQLTARAAFAQLEEAAEIHVDPSFSIVPGFSAFLNASAIADIQRHPLVDAVYEDVPGRPLLDESTALIGAQALWAQGLVGAGGAVAVLDTGVEKEHPMVGPAITASACFSSNASGISTSLCPDGSEEMINLTGADAGDACVDTRVDPENGSSGCYHGTHVASIAAGRFATLSSGVISGVARGADIVAINVFSRFPPEDCDEEGEDGSHCVRTFSSDQLKALEWIYTNREQLSVSSVNMSLGGGRHTSPCETHVLRPIIQNLLAADIATVIASGNDGYGDAVSSPACVPEAITVGATDAQDSVPSFSNSAESLDLLAPGVSITGAFLTEEPAPGENCAINDADPGADGVCHWFAGLSGTSMAAPHVAGAFTLLRAAVPGASVSDILAALDFTGAQIVDVNGITRSRIQVDAAHAVLEQGGVFAENVQLTPLSPFRTSGQAGVAASFASLEYTLTNQSFAGQTVTVVEKPAWIDAGPDSFVVPAMSSLAFTVSVEIAGLPQQAAGGQVRLQVGSESISIPVSIQVTRPLVSAEFGPFEWVGDSNAYTTSVFRLVGLTNGPPEAIDVAIGQGSVDGYSGDYTDCTLSVLPERYSGSEYVFNSDDLAACGAFGRADLRFRVLALSADIENGLRLRRFGVTPQGTLSGFGFDADAVATSGSALAGRRSSVAASEIQPEMLLEETASVRYAGLVGDPLDAPTSWLEPQSTTGEVEFGPFEWTGDANAYTGSIFRIGGLENGPPVSIDIAVDNATAGGLAGAFTDCSLSIRSDRYQNAEFVINQSDLGDCGSFVRGDLRFKIVADSQDTAAGLSVRRFAITRDGGLTDFGFDMSPTEKSALVALNASEGEIEFGPFQWTGDENAPTQSIFRLVGLVTGLPSQIDVAIGSASEAGFSDDYADCSLQVRAERKAGEEYLISSADLGDCGGFGRADLRFRVRADLADAPDGLRMRRFAVGAGSDITDFGFDNRALNNGGIVSGPSDAPAGTTAVEFGPFEWTGDGAASTQSVFRISGIATQAPSMIDVALVNSSSGNHQGDYGDCRLVIRPDRLGAGEYVISSDDLADCGAFGRADILFRVVAHSTDATDGLSMRRFAVNASGGLTDFGFDN